MKFGKELEQIINDRHPDWRQYAVDYKAMKKTLPGETPADKEHLQQQHGGEDFSAFWDIFEKSQAELDNFYHHQEAWVAMKQATLLESDVLRVSNAERMKEQLLEFRKKIELIEAFLLVNQTAFSKILKKFDKRTLSQVREEKLAELLEKAMYLDGKGMSDYLIKIDDKIRQLDELFKTPPPKAGEKRGRSHRRRPTDCKIHESTDMLFKDMDEKSEFFANNPPRAIPTFDQTHVEVDTEKLLGQGQFCSVYEVKSFNFSREDLAFQSFLSRQQQQSVNKPHYAIKQVNDFLEKSKMIDGAIDLAIEAKFLSCMEHPNIIQLCGTGDCGFSSKAFLILDRLAASLHDKIIGEWNERYQEIHKRKGILLFTSKEMQRANQELWRERLLALEGVANGIQYLHGHQIIHRDIKPANIGFDMHGTVKVFDFGLVKELMEKYKVGEDQFNATGRTGTRKYMAPEVVLYKPYGKPIDIYSFGLTCWETLSLKSPFQGYGNMQLDQAVIGKGARPKLPRHWSRDIKYMLNKTWCEDPSKRMNAEEVCHVLKCELKKKDAR